MYEMNPELLLLYDRFCVYAQTTRAATTALLYKSSLRRFFIHLKRENAQEVTPRHFMTYPGWLLKQSISRGAMRVHLSAARAFLEWLMISEDLDVTYSDKTKIDVAFKALYKKRESRLPVSVKPEDVERVRKQAYASTLPSPIRERNIALIELLYSSGCRINEACTLDARRVDFGQRKALVLGKGNKERWIYFSELAGKRIQQYWAAREYEGAPVFTRHDDGARKGNHKIALSPFGARNAIETIAEAAGVEGFHPHLFRHNFGTQTLNKTRDLALTQDLMGHASPTSTRIYAKVDEARMKKEHSEVWG